jgi:hypothetical protein
VNCYSCDAAATNACKRCARPYCDDHGNAQYCADCLKPASALPSFNLYRGSLLVMLVGTAVAIVLIMRPPSETKGASPVIVGRSSPTATITGETPTAGVTTGTPQPEGSAIAASGTPGASATPGAQATPGTPTTPVAAETPAPSPTASPFNEYVVQEGDSVASIAEAMLSPGDDLTAFENAIIALNNLDATDPILHPGQKLLLPKPTA